MSDPFPARRLATVPLADTEGIFERLVEGVRDYAIFLLDPGGHVMSWNEGAQRIKGYAPHEIIGKHISTFYRHEAVERRWPQHELKEAERTGRFEDEGWRVRKDGREFWANVIITPIKDPDGTLVGFSKITRDLTERRNAEDRLRQSEERFRLLLEGVQDYAIMMLDPTGRVKSWNTGAQRILGYTAAEIIGQPFERFYPEEDVLAGRPTQELRDAIVHRRAEDQGWRVRKDGTRFWADVVVTALTDASGELRGFAKVTRDLSERKRMESLEEQGRHLTEFLAMLAHELRNPLAPIRNALAIMGMQKELDPKLSWAREVIERQTVHLARLVDDLLDVSRITRGKLRMRTEPMDVNVAIQRAVESGRPLIDARKHRLKQKLGVGPMLVHGDMTRLTQVILNLLNNAAKYTPEGGEIVVESVVEGRDVLVRVRDNGEGMAPSLVEQVFDLFAQGERTLDRSQGGLGIGLTLARRIMELHGGSIAAHSAGQDQGSEFTVRIPHLELERGQVAGEAGHDAMPAIGQKRHILVVDDNHDAAESLALLLRMTGHDVDVEHEGEGALARAAQRMPEIVLLDIGLPGMSGYEVAQHLRARPEGQGVRIYAITGYGQEEDRRRSHAAGFDGHLMKPVMPAELLKLVCGPHPEPEL